MKTPLEIDERLMQRLLAEAARRGRTPSELVEEGLRRILDEGGQPAPRDSPSALPTWRSGGARVDVADRDRLVRALEDR